MEKNHFLGHPSSSRRQGLLRPPESPPRPPQPHLANLPSRRIRPHPIRPLHGIRRCNPTRTGSRWLPHDKRNLLPTPETLRRSIQIPLRCLYYRQPTPPANTHHLPCLNRLLLLLSSTATASIPDPPSRRPHFRLRRSEASQTTRLGLHLATHGVHGKMQTASA